jgi:heat shock protein HslJ
MYNSVFFAAALVAITVFGSGAASNDLGGTSWQLTEFVSPDHHVLRPDQKTKYAISFEKDGTVNIRSGCSRGRGTWKSSGSNLIEFGPLTFMRLKCPLTALDDYLPSDLQYVRLYFLKNEHLFLSLLADQGTYEFEPLNRQMVCESTVRERSTPRSSESHSRHCLVLRCATPVHARNDSQIL